MNCARTTGPRPCQASAPSCCPCWRVSPRRRGRQLGAKGRNRLGPEAAGTLVLVCWLLRCCAALLVCCGAYLGEADARCCRSGSQAETLLATAGWQGHVHGVLHHHFVHDILVGIMLQHMSQLEGHSNFHDAITAHLSALHVVLVRGRRLR